MTTNSIVIKHGLLGCIAMFAVGNVSANDDLNTCKAGYKTLLMTQGECKLYLKQLRAAQAKSDHLAVLDLQEWHTQLLIERSQACPCQNRPANMRSLSNMRMTSNSLQQSAYTTQY